LTEVPEHLLKRSRDRRSALGLGGGDSGASEAAPAAATSAAVEPAATAAPAPTAAAATPVEAAPAPPPFVPPYVEAAQTRKKVPLWVMPVLLFLPLWGVLYAQTFSDAPGGELTQLDEGAAIYAAQCASCHGGGGAGGVGRQLSDGEVLKTFPTIEGQLEYVALGTDGYGSGQPYGDPAREGGPHVAGSFGIMPAFGEQLTAEELLAVVRYEREVLGGEEPESSQLAADESLLWPSGTPVLEGEELLGAEGEPLFGEDGRLAARPEYEGGGGAAAEQAAG
jgi:mono/diheme cytochrome c family protein